MDMNNLRKTEQFTDLLAQQVLFMQLFIFTRKTLAYLIQDRPNRRLTAMAVG